MIEADSESTGELTREVERVKRNMERRIKLDAGHLGVKLGCLVNNSRGLVQLSRQCGQNSRNLGDA